MAGTIDKNLTNALKAARGGKPMQFAFLPKGAEGTLLVGKKILPKQIAEAKKETGASTVFKGRCIGADGTLVFELVKEPAGTFLGQLKKRLKDDAGITCPVEIRVNPTAESDSAEMPPAAPPAPGAAPGTPDSAKAAWEKALAEVEPTYRQHLRDQPDKANALRAVMAFAQGKAAKQDFASAKAALRKLTEQLTKLATSSGGPAPEKVGAASLNRWQAVKETLDLQIGALQQALKTNPDRRLHRIAELGLNGVSKNFQVGLRVALTELDQSAGDVRTKARDKALAIVTRYQKHLHEDKAIKLCEANPFGVEVNITATLGPALAEIERRIKSMAV